MRCQRIPRHLHLFQQDHRQHPGTFIGVVNAPHTNTSTRTGRVGRKKFVSLTREQHTRWLDRVFLPAVGEYFQAHYTQHLPGNFDHAYANSKAHQVGGRQVETASHGVQHAIGHHLQPEDLDHIWNEILTTVRDTPGLADFREP